jgi:hypothetical protein
MRLELAGKLRDNIEARCFCGAEERARDRDLHWVGRASNPQFIV